MAEASLEDKLRDAEQAVREAEQAHGPDSAEVAARLMEMAAILRASNSRMLDAVNLEARAKAIRAKMLKAEAADHQSGEVVKPQAEKRAQFSPWSLVGLGALGLAAASLFLDQQFFVVLASMSAVLAIGDFVLTRGQWLRLAAVAVLLVWAWAGVAALPPEMMTDASPMSRLNFSNGNHVLISRVKSLGKDETVFDLYRLRIPAGLKDETEEKADFGLVYCWEGEPGPAGTIPKFTVMRIKLEPDDRKRHDLNGLAHDVALPDFVKDLELEGLVSDSGETVESNGFKFILFNWSGQQRGTNQRMRGLLYVTRDGNELLTIGWSDFDPVDQEKFDQALASVYTFRKI